MKYLVSGSARIACRAFNARYYILNTSAIILAFVIAFTLLASAAPHPARAVAGPGGDIPVEGPRFPIGPPSIDVFTNKDASGPGIKGFKNKGLLAWVSPECVGENSEGECSLCDVIQVGVNIGNFILAIFGAVALIMFLWGGFGMVTARGDSEKIEGAKAVLWNALAGSVFILIAWQFVAIAIFLFTGRKDPFEGICS